MDVTDKNGCMCPVCNCFRVMTQIRTLQNPHALPSREEQAIFVSGFLAAAIVYGPPVPREHAEFWQARAEARIAEGEGDPLTVAPVMPGTENVRN